MIKIIIVINKCVIYNKYDYVNLFIIMIMYCNSLQQRSIIIVINKKVCNSLYNYCRCRGRGYRGCWLSCYCLESLKIW